MFPPKQPLDIISPEGGCSEGLDAFRFFLNTPNTNNAHTVWTTADAVTHIKSLSQEVGSGDKRPGLIDFDLSSSAETEFWGQEKEQEEEPKRIHGTWGQRLAAEAGGFECFLRMSFASYFLFRMT